MRTLGWPEGRLSSWVLLITRRGLRSRALGERVYKIVCCTVTVGCLLQSRMRIIGTSVPRGAHCESVLFIGDGLSFRFESLTRARESDSK
jgi:hypothetical protein